MIKRLLTASILLLVSLQVNAATISYGEYSHDTDTGIVLGDGLEWLKWSETDNMSYAQAINFASTRYGDGWEIATSDQVSGLVENFNFGLSWDPQNPTNEYVSSLVDSDYQSGSFYNFVSMFGYTYYGWGGNNYANWSTRGSQAFFGSIDISTNTANRISVKSYGSISNINCCRFKETATLNLDDYNSNSGGVALTRTSTVSPPISTVPVPSSIVLFAAGFFGLGFARRKRQA
jgi:hypothetical protein